MEMHNNLTCHFEESTPERASASAGAFSMRMFTNVRICNIFVTKGRGNVPQKPESRETVTERKEGIIYGTTEGEAQGNSIRSRV